MKMRCYIQMSGIMNPEFFGKHNAPFLGMSFHHAIRRNAIKALHCHFGGSATLVTRDCPNLHLARNAKRFLSSEQYAGARQRQSSFCSFINTSENSVCGPERIRKICGRRDILSSFIKTRKELPLLSHSNSFSSNDSACSINFSLFI